MLKSVLLMGICLILVGCGQDGALYLPPAQTAAPTATPTAS